MNISTIIVALILAAIVVFIVRDLIKKKGNTCGCGCGCEHCAAACGSSAKKDPPSDEK